MKFKKPRGWLLKQEVGNQVEFLIKSYSDNKVQDTTWVVTRTKHQKMCHSNFKKQRSSRYNVGYHSSFK